ncbi:MAG: acyl-CoA thioesterase [Deltaproteobacteria bacterium]|nr:acyl-CoA thioesterase [Candidatus Anaeroferrophillus wilburensis]MBN2888560.1 acyl-CoA thioesterase [Deltaproteobacteria bacterium]
MIEITVRSTHIDMFGHVNNATYIEFLEWSRVRMAEDHGIDLLALAAEGIGPAVVHLDINYRKESRMNDVLLVDAKVSEIRNDKVGVITQTITNKKTGERVCDARVTFVMFDLQRRKSIPMPESMKAMAPAMQQ